MPESRFSSGSQYRRRSRSSLRTSCGAGIRRSGKCPARKCADEAALGRHSAEQQDLVHLAADEQVCDGADGSAGRPRVSDECLRSVAPHIRCGDEHEFDCGQHAARMADLHGGSAGASYLPPHSGGRFPRSRRSTRLITGRPPSSPTHAIVPERLPSAMIGMEHTHKKIAKPASQDEQAPSPSVMTSGEAPRRAIAPKSRCA